MTVHSPHRPSNDGSPVWDRVWVGFDPGKDKCGLAALTGDGTPRRYEIAPTDRALATLTDYLQQFQVVALILGDGTTSRQWQERLSQAMADLPPLHLVDERYSTLDARKRYWQLHPPQGLARLLPLGTRLPPRPIDDVAAIVLVERYLCQHSPSESFSD